MLLSYFDLIMSTPYKFSTPSKYWLANVWNMLRDYNGKVRRQDILCCQDCQDATFVYLIKLMVSGERLILCYECVVNRFGGG